jgi:uncharacterized BrkB/YihY/UPF0761 family membrane protein
MKSTLTLLTGLLVAATLPYVTHAKITSPLANQSLEGVVLIVVNVVQILLIMATVLYLLYAGLMFVTAQGEPGKITKARNALLWGMVGAALILGAQIIVTTLKTSVESVLK